MQGKRGSIALARELCVQIAGYTDDDQDQCGHDYGSVDIAEILSAEVVRLQKALAQPEQQAETPPEWPLIKNILDEYGLDAIAFVAEFKAAQRPWVGLTDEDWGWVANRKGTSLDTFAHGAAWAADILKGRNT